MRRTARIAGFVLAAGLTVPAWANWTFERDRDAMTGAVTCSAVSPAQHMLTGSGYETAPVRLVVSVAGTRVLAGLRVDTSTKGLLHPNMAGGGVKVEPGSFHATSMRADQTWVALADSAKAVDEMLLGRSVRLRVKFWPYDKPVDSQAISTVGLPQAVLKAAECK